MRLPAKARAIVVLEAGGRLASIHRNRMRSARAFAILLISVGVVFAAPDNNPSETNTPPSAHRPYTIEGWTVLVNRRLLADEKAATEKALEILRAQLQEIVRVVPSPAVARLQEVTLWFSPEYRGVKPKAEYHPGAGWLRDNGRDAAMVKGIEFTDIKNFEAEARRMPNFTLHELAHAYHDRVLPDGFSNMEIKAAFERAKARKSYEKVERWFGNGKPNTFERAYAMTNPQEYFAETTEAYFSRNDYFPFTRAELQQHDPDMNRLLKKLWGVVESGH